MDKTEYIPNNILLNPVDAIKLCIEQAKGCKYKPSVALMNIGGEVINIIDPKNKKKVEKYLKLNK